MIYEHKTSTVPNNHYKKLYVKETGSFADREIIIAGFTGVSSEGGYTVVPELNKQIMQQLADESVMCQICTIKTTRSNEYKQLVSVGGAAVAHGEEGKARSETATPKMEEVSIKLFPIYAYPKRAVGLGKLTRPQTINESSMHREVRSDTETRTIVARETTVQATDKATVLGTSTLLAGAIQQMTDGDYSLASLNISCQCGERSEY